ncbi:unnamed protein product [Notodromas monacha]|uniref:Uncharacterized protein n=1 Tax=Notodromas monacha TaxID=399045 RepID=A0A7R9GEU2_9CRUS|nr:unnamed protein product [Notodromas monacha]CAG0918622.1 unnamed protein product [Notodromas monacha]
MPTMAQKRKKRSDNVMVMPVILIFLHTLSFASPALTNMDHHLGLSQTSSISSSPLSSSSSSSSAAAILSANDRGIQSSTSSPIQTFSRSRDDHLFSPSCKHDRDMYTLDPSLASDRLRQEPCIKQLLESEWHTRYSKDGNRRGSVTRINGCTDCRSNDTQDIAANLAWCLSLRNENCCSCLFRLRPWLNAKQMPTMEPGIPPLKNGTFPLTGPVNLTATERHSPPRFFKPDRTPTVISNQHLFVHNEVPTETGDVSVRGNPITAAHQKPVDLALEDIQRRLGSYAPKMLYSDPNNYLLKNRKEDSPVDRFNKQSARSPHDPKTGDDIQNILLNPIAWINKLSKFKQPPSALASTKTGIIGLIAEKNKLSSNVTTTTTTVLPSAWANERPKEILDPFPHVQNIALAAEKILRLLETKASKCANKTKMKDCILHYSPNNQTAEQTTNYFKRLENRLRACQQQLEFCSSQVDDGPPSLAKSAGSNNVSIGDSAVGSAGKQNSSSNTVTHGSTTELQGQIAADGLEQATTKLTTGKDPLLALGIPEVPIMASQQDMNSASLTHETVEDLFKKIDEFKAVTKKALLVPEVQAAALLRKASLPASTTTTITTKPSSPPPTTATPSTTTSTTTTTTTTIPTTAYNTVPTTKYIPLTSKLQPTSALSSAEKAMKLLEELDKKLSSDPEHNRTELLNIYETLRQIRIRVSAKANRTTGELASEPTKATQQTTLHPMVNPIGQTHEEDSLEPTRIVTVIEYVTDDPDEEQILVKPTSIDIEQMAKEAADERFFTKKTEFFDGIDNEAFSGAQSGLLEGDKKSSYSKLGGNNKVSISNSNGRAQAGEALNEVMRVPYDKKIETYSGRQQNVRHKHIMKQLNGPRFTQQDYYNNNNNKQENDHQPRRVHAQDPLYQSRQQSRQSMTLMNPRGPEPNQAMFQLAKAYRNYASKLQPRKPVAVAAAAPFQQEMQRKIPNIINNNNNNFKGAVEQKNGLEKHYGEDSVSCDIPMYHEDTWKQGVSSSSLGQKQYHQLKHIKPPPPPQVVPPRAPAQHADHPAAQVQDPQGLSLGSKPRGSRASKEFQMGWTSSERPYEPAGDPQAYVMEQPPDYYDFPAAAGVGDVGASSSSIGGPTVYDDGYGDNVIADGYESNSVLYDSSYVPDMDLGNSVRVRRSKPVKLRHGLGELSEGEKEQASQTQLPTVWIFKDKSGNKTKAEIDEPSASDKNTDSEHSTSLTEDSGSTTSSTNAETTESTASPSSNSSATGTTPASNTTSDSTTPTAKAGSSEESSSTSTKSSTDSGSSSSVEKSETSSMASTTSKSDDSSAATSADHAGESTSPQATTQSSSLSAESTTNPSSSDHSTGESSSTVSLPGAD